MLARAIWIPLVVACSSPRAPDVLEQQAPHVTAELTKPPPTTPTAIAQLAVAEWNDVWKAKAALERDRVGSLAALVAMVDRDDRVPLTNTADLIYPGATQFYGHGYGVSYDLDHLGDRAAWVLEEITFRDFGFSDGVSAWGPEEPVHAVIRRKRARAAAHAWWRTARQGWSCYAALAESLKSTTPEHAYRWLRDWNAIPCDGFTAERFKRELLPIVEQHRVDKHHPMQIQADELLKSLDEQLARLTRPS